MPHVKSVHALGYERSIERFNLRVSPQDTAGALLRGVAEACRTVLEVIAKFAPGRKCSQVQNRNFFVLFFFFVFVYVVIVLVVAVPFGSPFSY